MSDLSQGALTLGAVVTGGLVSYLGAALSEKKRFQRERASRWDQRRLEACLAYATAMKDEIRITMRIASGVGAGPKTDPLGLPDGKLFHEKAEHARSTLFEAVMLLGDSATVAAARIWQQSAWDCYQHVSKEQNGDSGDFMALYRLAGDARSAYYECVRKSLAIEGWSPADSVMNDSIAAASSRF